MSAPDPNDPVVKSHYRLMRHFIADDPKPLVPGELHARSASVDLRQWRAVVGSVALSGQRDWTVEGR